MSASSTISASWSGPVRRIAVFGAYGGTGRHILDQAAERGLETVAIERSQPEGELPPTCEFRHADVLEDDLEPLIEDCDAVISALGVGLTPSNAISPPPLYSEGTGRILRAMESAGLARIAVISAAFVTSQPNLPGWFRNTVVPVLENILVEMREMEHRLETASSIAWTAARPGWLLDTERSGGALIHEGNLPENGFRCREGDLAELLLDAVEKGAWQNSKPVITSPVDSSLESPLALGKEFAELLTKQI